MSEVVAPGYVKDVRSLIKHYTEGGRCSFQAFKSLWKARGFSFIHDGCPKNVNPRRYLQILSCIALGFLQPYRRERHNPKVPPSGTPKAPPNGTPRVPPTGTSRVHPNDNSRIPSNVRPQANGDAAELPLEVTCAAAGAVYTVYSLFYSQHSSPPTLVYVSPEDLEALFLFAEDTGRQHQAWEAFLCLQRLQREKAFLYGAVPFRDRDVFGCTEEEAAVHQRIIQRQLTVMREKLFAHTPLEEHLETDLVQLLNVGQADLLGREYEAALKALPAPPASASGEREKHSTASGARQSEVLFVQPNELSHILKGHTAN